MASFDECYQQGNAHGYRAGFWSGAFVGFFLGVLFALVLLLATRASAQVSLALGEDCVGEISADRTCLALESSLADLTDLRNEVTRTMVAAGGGDCGGVSCYVLLVCDQCSVDKDIEGCEWVNDRVVMHRWSVLAHRLGCLLTEIRGQGLARVAQETALRRLNRAADIGSGTPDVTDKRGCDAEGCG